MSVRDHKCRTCGTVWRSDKPVMSCAYDERYVAEMHIDLAAQRATVAELEAQLQAKDAENQQQQYQLGHVAQFLMEQLGETEIKLNAAERRVEELSEPSALVPVDEAEDT